MTQHQTSKHNMSHHFLTSSQHCLISINFMFVVVSDHAVKSHEITFKLTANYTKCYISVGQKDRFQLKIAKTIKRNQSYFFPKQSEMRLI